MVLGVVGSAGVLAWLVTFALGSIHPVAYVIGGALLLRTTFTVTGLKSAAMLTQRELAGGNLKAARESLRNLVSRDASALRPSLVAAAAIESVAENSTDSIVGPWLAFALFGVPGAIVYRAINTMDSVVGYRGAYEFLGKPAARLDDLVNLIPARLGAVLLLSSGPFARLPMAQGWRVMRRDRHQTASPNAGWTMSAMAGLLGVQLEKLGHYRLGQGLRNPSPDDIERAVAVLSTSAVLAALVALGLLAGRLAISG
jgi:adenosylcobinamide-phosphate synthase